MRKIIIFIIFLIIIFITNLMFYFLSDDYKIFLKNLKNGDQVINTDIDIYDDNLVKEDIQENSIELTNDEDNEIIEEDIYEIKEDELINEVVL